MPKRIGPRQPRRIYLAQWRESRALTQKQLGERLGVTDITVSRWERATRALNTTTLEAVADALQIEPQDLYRPPSTPSLDAMLRDAPEAIRRQALAIIETLRKTGT